MARVIPARKAQARRIHSTLTREGFDRVSLREQLEDFQHDYADAILAAAAALRDHNVLAGVDSTRYRTGVDPDHASRKIAEAVERTVLHLKYGARLKHAREERSSDWERRTDVYRKAAHGLQHIDPKESASFQRKADFFNGMKLHRVPGQPSGYRDLPPSKQLNILVLDLLAIFTHLTDLTEHHVLDQVVPKIVALLAGAVSRRGEPHPLKRYKDAKVRIVSWERNIGNDRFTMKDDLFLRRCLLFAEDDRFDLSLFAPHRQIRTVPHHAGRVSHR